MLRILSKNRYIAKLMVLILIVTSMCYPPIGTAHADEKTPTVISSIKFYFNITGLAGTDTSLAYTCSTNKSEVSGTIDTSGGNGDYTLDLATGNADYLIDLGHFTKYGKDMVVTLKKLLINNSTELNVYDKTIHCGWNQQGFDYLYWGYTVGTILAGGTQGYLICQTAGMAFIAIPPTATPITSIKYDFSFEIDAKVTLPYNLDFQLNTTASNIKKTIKLESGVTDYSLNVAINPGEVITNMGAFTRTDGITVTLNKITINGTSELKYNSDKKVLHFDWWASEFDNISSHSAGDIIALGSTGYLQANSGKTGFEYYDITSPVSVSPTTAPTVAPTTEPTVAPTTEPTVAPTTEPTVAPTTEPTVAPTTEPTVAPTTEPTVAPTTAPTTAPTLDFDDLGQNQIVTAMGAGWNLGNQLEACSSSTVDGTTIQTPNETAWGNPVITQNLIDAVANAGFKTIRIPITWGDKIGSAPNYTIDQNYMNRVKQVVDYAMKDDLYVIINIHHDAWLNQTLSPDQATINDKLGKVWTQIATTFESYDEHLIFESMNEIGGDTYHMTDQEIAQCYTSTNAYNQTFVNKVRATGGNNPKRWLLIPGINTNIDMTVDDSFVIPDDSLCTASGKRLMISVHYYGPWEFALRDDDIITQWGIGAPDITKTAGWGNEDYMTSQIQSVYNRFVTQGYPIVIGEFGSIDKSQADPANAQCRILYAKTLCELAKKYGAVPVYWDNGYNQNHQFGIFDRSNDTITQPGIINAIINTFSKTPTIVPTIAPTTSPSGGGGSIPIVITEPTKQPTVTPTPTIKPTVAPTIKPTVAPTAAAESKQESLNGIPNALNISVSQGSNGSEINATIVVQEDQVLNKAKLGNVDLTIPVGSKSIVDSILNSNNTDINIAVTIPSSLQSNDNVTIKGINLDSSILEAASQTQNDVTVKIKDENGKVQYSWTFGGEELAASGKDIGDVDLSMSVESITQNSDLGDVLGDSKQSGVVLNFNHHGVLPAEATVKIYVGDMEGINSGKKVYLYYYNPDTGKLESLPNSSYKVDKEGYININLIHCSDYVALTKKADNTKITSLSDQIKVKATKTTLYKNNSKKNTAKIKITLPSTLQLVRSLKDKTSGDAVGAVTVSYSSSNNKVVKVNKDGTITAVGKGTATIKVTIKLYSGKTKVVTIKINVK